MSTQEFSDEVLNEVESANQSKPSEELSEQDLETVAGGGLKGAAIGGVIGGLLGGPGGAVIGVVVGSVVEDIT